MWSIQKLGFRTGKERSWKTHPLFLPLLEKACTWGRIKDVSVFKMNSEKICHCFPACSMLG